MIPKMIRLALVLLAVLVMALEFPKIYKKNLGNKTDKIKTLDKYKIYCYNTKRVLNYSLLHKKP